MAGSETDPGADAVALAIRDLTEEIRKLRVAHVTAAGALLLSKQRALTPDEVRVTIQAFETLMK